MNKNDKTIDRKLDCLDKITNVNTFHEFDNEITHLKGRIPILDQYLNMLLQHHLPLMKNFLPLHQNKMFNWMMQLRGMKN